MKLLIILAVFAAGLFVAPSANAAVTSTVTVSTTGTSSVTSTVSSTSTSTVTRTCYRFYTITSNGGGTNTVTFGKCAC